MATATVRVGNTLYTGEIVSPESDINMEAEWLYNIFTITKGDNGLTWGLLNSAASSKEDSSEIHEARVLVKAWKAVAVESLKHKR